MFYVMLCGTETLLQMETFFADHHLCPCPLLFDSSYSDGVLRRVYVGMCLCFGGWHRKSM